MPSRWLDYILAHPDKPWCWNEITRNAAVTWDDIEAHPECPWSWAHIQDNPNTKWIHIVKHLDKFRKSMYSVSMRSDLDFAFVLAHPELDWCWHVVSANPAVTWDTYKKHKYWNHPDTPFFI